MSILHSRLLEARRLRDMDAWQRIHMGPSCAWQWPPIVGSPAYSRCDRAGEAMPPALCVEAGDGQDRAHALGWG